MYTERLTLGRPTMFVLFFLGCFFSAALARAGEPGDEWLGEWTGRSLYVETERVWEWWFEVQNVCGRYQVQTHTEGPDQTEILKIDATHLEFLFHDALGTHVTMTRTGDRYSGTVHQPNNEFLPQGRIEGERTATPPAKDLTGHWEGRYNWDRTGWITDMKACFVQENNQLKGNYWWSENKSGTLIGQIVDDKINYDYSGTDCTDSGYFNVSEHGTFMGGEYNCGDKKGIWEFKRIDNCPCQQGGISEVALFDSADVNAEPGYSVRFTDRDFNPVDEIVIYVVYPGGPGTGEVWIEVEADEGHPNLDDDRIDRVTVRVSTTSDDEGDSVECVETANASRIFRSTRAVLFYPARVKIEA